MNRVSDGIERCFAELNLRDSEQGHSRGYKLGRTVVLLMAIASIGAGGVVLAHGIHNAIEHNVEYLDDCHKDPRTAEEGDTFDRLLDKSNPSGISTEEKWDAEEQYKQTHGDSLVVELGQKVEVPVFETCGGE